MKVILLACLGLMFFLDPAFAQPPYSLDVRIHEAVRPRLKEEHIKTILEGASDLLIRRNHCNVEFKLNTYGKFSSAPAVINNASDLEAVHNVDAHVKIVRQINYCFGRPGSYLGCAWRPPGLPKTMIVVRDRSRDRRPILWAHEFAHTTGLHHRDEPAALMKPCVGLGSVTVNHRECSCLRSGPGTCLNNDPNPICPPQRETR